ncbi:unnamed protein product [Effrenium voratum]|nr:unnamed protein product [Effrenium voratum]
MLGRPGTMGGPKGLCLPQPRFGPQLHGLDPGSGDSDGPSSKRFCHRVLAEVAGQAAAAPGVLRRLALGLAFPGGLDLLRAGEMRMPGGGELLRAGRLLFQPGLRAQPGAEPAGPAPAAGAGGAHRGPPSNAADRSDRSEEPHVVHSPVSRAQTQTMPMAVQRISVVQRSITPPSKACGDRGPI